jgi:DNA-binding NarL/FixJ family response regulator
MRCFFKPPEWSPLSLREKQLVELIQQAKSNKEIAYELSLTVGSVKEYLHRIFRKLGVRNRTELALWKRDGETSLPPAGTPSGSWSDVGVH